VLGLAFEANSSSCFSVIDSYMFLEAPLSSITRLATLGGERGTRSLLLRGRFGWHRRSPVLIHGQQRSTPAGVPLGACPVSR